MKFGLTFLHDEILISFQHFAASSFDGSSNLIQTSCAVLHLAIQAGETANELERTTLFFSLNLFQRLLRVSPRWTSSDEISAA